MQRLAECAAFVLGTSSAEQNARSPLLRTRAIRIGLPRAFKPGVLSAIVQVAGGSLKDAQAQLGHTKLSTTLEIYTVPIPAHQRAAVENLARLVTNGDELGQCAGGLPGTIQQIQ